MKNVYSPTGSTVWVGHDGNVEKALRNFKKKVLESGKLQELRRRECYTKPSIKRKQNAAAAKNRWKKILMDQKLPEKPY